MKRPTLADSLRIVAAIAAIGMFYLLLGYAFDSAGDATAVMRVSHVLGWRIEPALEWHFPKLVGFVILSLAAVGGSLIWFSVFQDFDWKEDRWPKFTTLVLGLGLSVLVISGGVVNLQDARLHATQTHTQTLAEENAGRAVLTAQRDALQRQIDEFARGRSIRDQAFTAGEKAWRARVEIAKAQKPDAANTLLQERAIGDAIQGDQRRGELAALNGKIASAPVTQEAERLARQRVAGLDVTEFIGNYRNFLWTIVCDLIAIFSSWLAKRHEQKLARAPAAAAPNTEASNDAGDPDKIKVRGHDRVRTKQRRLRPATAEELAAARGDATPGDDPASMADEAGGGDAGAPHHPSASDAATEKADA